VVRSRLVISALAICMALAAACGSKSGPKADRTVTITMRATAFQPPSLSVRSGETVEFRFTNDDTATHEAYIGDSAAQDAHEMEMADGGGGGHNAHGAQSAVTVDAGKTKSLRYTFAAPGTLLIGCHEKGHYTAGMKMSVTIT
jgi:uncharacterized cupredoxin-like copper-binding protein